MNIDFISAICTPLDGNENLDRKGLRVHLDQQWEYGASGVLIGGTMGLMQLLRDSTYSDLMRTGVDACQGKGEILVGVGDTSFARTLEKIEAVSDLPIDAVVAVTPWFYPFSEEEVFNYYCALAKASKHPLYLYYLPKLTGVELQIETILRLAEQPNIRGIKSSANTDWTMQLFERVPSSFRVIVSAPFDTTKLAQMGVSQFLDGIYAVFPKLSGKLLAALRAEDWAGAARCEFVLSRALEMLRSAYPLFGATSAILNGQGVSGKCNVSPLGDLPESLVQEVLGNAAIQAAIAGEVADEDLTKSAA